MREASGIKFGLQTALAYLAYNRIEGGVAMRPVVFDECFGWLHPASGRTGVVLCNPFGYDALCTHRGWRKLAERLAAAGMPVLRFDYPGTGDAAGAEDDPGRVDAWIESIGAAVRRLRAWTGVERVALVGLRLGATLAALAAERSGDIDALAMLAPPVTGRRYIRELRAHRQGWLSTSAGAGAAHLDEDDPYVEAFGFGLHGADITRLSEVDLCRDTSAPARRVLLLDSSGTNLVAKLAQHYASHGVAVGQETFEESDKFFLEALYSEEPVDAYARVSAWLQAEALPGSPSARAAHSDPEPELSLPRYRASERPVVFGRCFGIHCAPAAPRAGVPAVLLVNTGAAHHIGDGRIAVLLARRLAAHGVASLRMDLGGLGDAVPAAEAITLDLLYSDGQRDDAAAGADWLAARGHARVVTFGVCGGAFVGLHASAVHPHVVGAYGVNLQKFTWDGPERSPGEQRVVSSKTYWNALWDADKWRRALRGQTASSPLQIVRVLSRRIVRRGWGALAGRIERMTGRVIAASEARVLLRRVQAKHVSVRLVYGDYDMGLEEARLQFGASFDGLRGLSRVRTAVLTGLDHALFTREARYAVLDDFETWFSAQWSSADAHAMDNAVAQSGAAASSRVGTPARS
jgi:pimeloyl-ACP methyl ester carboxylesterase